MSLRRACLVLVALCVVPAAAVADLAPPPGFVETCTVERQQLPGEACRLCTGAFHGDPDHCVHEYGSQGFAHRCNTRGASVWSEVWCATPEVAAAWTPGGGSPVVEVVLTTPGSGEGAPPAGAPTEGSAPEAAEGSVPAVDDPAAAAEIAPVAAGAEGAPAAVETDGAPESAPATTPGRRGCAAGGGGLAACGWLALAALRRRRARGVVGAC